MNPFLFVGLLFIICTGCVYLVQIFTPKKYRDYVDKSHNKRVRDRVNIRRIDNRPGLKNIEIGQDRFN